MQSGCGFKNAGKKLVSIPCSESQFHAIFANHIHFYSKKSGVYKCWFRGKEGEEKLNQIFGSTDWEIKYYNQNQRTFIVLTDNNVSHQKTETNPLALATAKKANSIIKPKKSLNKYKYGEMLVEWKCRHDKDAMVNEASHSILTKRAKSMTKQVFNDFTNISKQYYNPEDKPLLKEV
ncbi:22021_t:CDS:2 [Rhizophagus irregularis]|nr:22021_t:CDS:2 [Rhizophagus irregularis]